MRSSTLRRDEREGRRAAGRENRGAVADEAKRFAAAHQNIGGVALLRDPPHSALDAYLRAARILHAQHAAAGNAHPRALFGLAIVVERIHAVLLVVKRRGRRSRIASSAAHGERAP